jgi:hypothetical protein
LIVSGILWALYAVWEYLIAAGVTCDANCNIRVDLVFIFPILAIATVYARRSYMRPPGPPTVLGWALGAAGLVVVALGSVLFGYIAPAAVAGVCALALGGYAIKLWYKGTSL